MNTQLNSKAVTQYLLRHAEAEISISTEISNLNPELHWHSTVVIPARREGSDLLSLILSLESAAQCSANRNLAILIINGSSSEVGEHHHLIQKLQQKYADAKSFSLNHGWLFLKAPLDLLIIDRFSETRSLTPKQGVGLARKIGCDIALQLIDQGLIQYPWIRSTDADVVVSEDYFDDFSSSELTSASVYPFWHQSENLSHSQSLAVELYELSLRYYVVGLRYAESPYAFHTIGSTMAVSAAAYAKVRGFPKLEAGEDFYLLNKLLKVGPIQSFQRNPILIQGRTSDRTPFGTGAAIFKILHQFENQKEFLWYHPLSFECLKLWILVAQSFCRDGNLQNCRDRLSTQDPSYGFLEKILENEFDAFQHLERIRQGSSSTATRVKSFHIWFDGFQTLKLIHHLRALALPSLPWQKALQIWGIEAKSSLSLTELRKRLIHLEKAGWEGLDPLSNGRIVDADDRANA